MKKVSAFILAILYSIYAVASIAGEDQFNITNEDEVVVVKHDADKETNKTADHFAPKKIAKHATAVKSKYSRSHAVQAGTGNEVFLYPLTTDQPIVAVLHPHLEHTPLFLKNRVLLI